MATLTGQQLLEGFSDFIEDTWRETATGGTTTTVVDTTFGQFGDDAIRDMYIRMRTACHGADGEVSRISGFTGTTATVAPAFTAAVACGNTYEMHRYHPEAKFRALDRATIQLTDRLFLECRDDTTTSDGRNTEFTIPTCMRLGPEWAIVEHPLPVNVQENWLSNPQLDVTCKWAAGCTTAVIVTKGGTDLLIPKHGESATKLSTTACTSATYQQVVACFSSCVTTPATAARDLHMYGGLWVHSTEVSKVRLRLVEDCCTITQGALHSGSGWEWLTVDKVIGGGNATLLTFGVCIATTANASVIHVQCGMLRHGPIPEFFTAERAVRVERCEVLNLVFLREAPAAGLNIRFVGKKPMSALGAVAACQITNTVEVDVNSAELLYGRAARLLFSGDMLNSPGFRDIANRISYAAQQEEVLRRQWQYRERGGQVISPFHR